MRNLLEKFKELEKSGNKEHSQEEITPERLDELDLLTKSIEFTPKNLKFGFKPIITIRKLMAVREMFNLKAPKKVNKKSLADLIIISLKLIK